MDGIFQFYHVRIRMTRTGRNLLGMTFKQHAERDRHPHHHHGDGEEVIYITTDSNMYMRFEGGKFYFTGSSAPGTLALDEKRMKLLRA